MMMVYPWQIKQWQQLLLAKQEERLPHALLFSGIPGTGKTQFADHFIHLLLCQKIINDVACHHCHACRLIAGKTHPNVLWIDPEKAGQAIKVDQIRSVSEFIYQSSLQGEYRIVVINPANQMNANAANALLKMLEEPPLGVILILISDQSSSLPATIVSRCQRFVFPSPTLSQALPWVERELQLLPKNAMVIDAELLLKLSHGAPLAAIQWVKTGIFAARHTLYQHLCALTQQSENPLAIAASISEIDILSFIDFMLIWELDLLRLILGASRNHLINLDFATQLISLKEEMHHKLDMKFLTYLQRLRTEISRGINMNKQLLMESVLIQYRS